jgi:hypothetical protein
METVKVKAGVMQVAAVTAIANIANRAVDAGITMAKSLTFEPIMQGFGEYELKMKSIQTILSNTKGETLKTVSGYLEELNTYSDQTIYNFANMTQNIGKLTTAGVGLEDATAVVKGFHNMVALAGGDATAAAGALEQFVYGLQAGTIKALDWQSIATRGLGSQSLQTAFFETAKAAGTLEGVSVDTTFEQWSKAVGGFKGSLESGWLTADVATKALSIMTGDMKSVEDIMAQGFSRKAAEDLFKIAEAGVESATKVRTFTGFMDTLKEQIGSGWSKVFELVIGDFNEATTLFTKWSDFSGKILGKFFGYLERLIGGFDKLGGRTAILQTFKNLLAPIAAIIGLVAKAWKLAFGGGDTGRGLATWAKALQHITRPLQILAKVISGQLTPLEGFKRLIEVNKNAVRNFLDYIGGFGTKLSDLITLKVPGAGGVINFIKDMAREIGEVIGKIDDLIRKGEGIGDIFSGFKKPSLPDVPSLPSLPGVSGIFGGGQAESKISGLTGGLKSLTGSVEDLKKADDDLSSGGMFNPDADISAGRVNDLGSMADQMAAQGQKVEAAGGIMSTVWDTIKEKFQGFLESFNFDDLMASFNIAVLSVFFIRMSQMMKTFSDGFKGFTGAMGGIESALGSFQTTARAKLILNIAIAIGILAAAIWVLSRIPRDKLVNALTALAGIAIILKVTLSSFANTIEKLDGKGINLKMLALGASMVLLAISVSIIASAMKKLNDVDWQSVVKAGVALGLLTIAMRVLGEVDNAGIIRTAIAMGIIAGALTLFAGAIKLFSLLDFATFGEGMLYVATALGVLALTMNKFTTSLPGAIALVVVVGALALLEPVIKRYAALDFGTFAKGMGLITAALVALVFTLHGFTTSLAGAAAMIVVVYGLERLHETIGLFANMDWGTFAKGMGMVVIALVGLGGALMLLGLGAPLMLAAAGALLVFAAAVALIGIGLLALTSGLAALIALGAGLGVAITAFFTSLAVGFAVFMTTLAAEAPILKKAFLDILQVLIDSIVEAVPMIIDGIKRLFTAVKEQFSGGEGTKVKGLMGKESKSWIEKIRDSIKEKIPEIVKKAKELLISFIKGLASNAKGIASAAANLVANVISGIASRIGGIVDAAVDLVVKFAEGLGNNLERLVKAGIKLIADFLHAVADGIRSGASQIGAGLTDILDAMKDVGMDMVQGLIDGVIAMGGKAIGAIGDLASNMISEARSKFKIFSPSKVFRNIGAFLVEGLTKGIQDNAVSAVTAVASMVGGQIAVANEYVSSFIQKLDQQAIKAGAKASGLAAAAEEAARSADRAAAEADKAAAKADKTKKNKKDDRAAAAKGRRAEKASNAADRIAKRAERAERDAEKFENKALKAKEAQDRAEEFAESDTLRQAQMRSEDAQTQMEEAKAAEQRAAANLVEADALEKQAKAKGVSKKEAKRMLEEAENLRKQAKAQAKAANASIAAARTSASEALALQKLAGDQAAASFQAQFEADAAAEAKAEAYEKMNDEEKAKSRRADAAALQAKAEKDLADAKALAYTDLEAANDLAKDARDTAALARQYIDDAEDLEQALADRAAQGTGQVTAATGGRVVNLDTTEAASIAFNQFTDRLNASAAAAAGDRTVQFNQYNSSPEALSPTEVYRQTNNLVSYAADKLTPSAA